MFILQVLDMFSILKLCTYVLFLIKSENIMSLYEFNKDLSGPNPVKFLFRVLYSLFYAAEDSNENRTAYLSMFTIIISCNWYSVSRL